MVILMTHKHLVPTGSKPLKLKAQVIPGYWVDPDGKIWSTKDPGNPRMLATHVSGKSPYHKLGVMINNKRMFVDLHRAVAESLLPMPKPKEIRRVIWRQMSATEKSFCWQAYEVNHIDHDRLNNHPDNLEWVCKRENLDKRNAHYY
jgi:hypothetical protein